MKESEIVSIDDLIEIVEEGGAVRTGIDFYSDNGDLLLEKDVLITRTSTLIRLKELGQISLPFDSKKEGVIWDKNGKKVTMASIKEASADKDDLETKRPLPLRLTRLENRVKEIQSVKQQAERIQIKARESILTAVNQIKESGGEFDTEQVTEAVCEAVDFIQSNEEAPLHLAREIFDFDNYIYNHSVNVCSFGIAILQCFSNQFAGLINSNLSGLTSIDNGQSDTNFFSAFVLYQEEEIKEIALGYLLHDIGKALIPNRILNKQDPLDSEEFEMVTAHSFRFGTELLNKNRIKSSIMHNIVRYHHAAIYPGEERTYPDNKQPLQIPLYVKICRLVDMYDAMTSRRAYRDAMNPISAITDIVRQYSGYKEKCLQLVLAAFIKTIGVYPPGSVVFLRSGQLAYVLKPKGPVIIPFTDSFLKPLSKIPDPIDLNMPRYQEATLQIDRRKPLPNPITYHQLLPAVLR